MAFDISAQIEKWRSLLLDTTKRNRLVSFKTGRSGGIPLVHPDASKLWQLIVGSSKSPNESNNSGPGGRMGVE
jgi:hypothetical protein